MAKDNRKLNAKATNEGITKEKKIDQNTKNTSPPKRIKLSIIKSINIHRNFCKLDSVASSVLLALGPCAAFPGPALLGPKMSSQVKLRVNSAGNKPRPMTKPPFWLPKSVLLANPLALAPNLL